MWIALKVVTQDTITAQLYYCQVLGEQRLPCTG